jgi:hypothetical protein
MRMRPAAVEPAGAPFTAIFPAPDGEPLNAARAGRPPAGEVPACADEARRVSGAMLALGISLLVFVPVAGVLFLVAGGLGLAIAAESPGGEATTAPPGTDG